MNSTRSVYLLVLLVVVALGCAAFCSGCGSNQQAFKWTGLDMAVEATPDGVDGEIGAGFAFWGVPIDIEFQYSNETIGACAYLGGEEGGFPFCIKRPIGDGGQE